MAQTPHQRRASDRVLAWLANNSRDAQWLDGAIEAEPGTTADFLKGRAWPDVATRERVELALGWPGGGIGRMGDGVSPAVAGAFVADPAFPDNFPGSVPIPGEHVKQGATNDEVLVVARDLADGLRELNSRLDRIEQWMERDRYT